MLNSRSSVSIFARLSLSNRFNSIKPVNLLLDSLLLSTALSLFQEILEFRDIIDVLQSLFRFSRLTCCFLGETLSVATSSKLNHSVNDIISGGFASFFTFLCFLFENFFSFLLLLLHLSVMLFDLTNIIHSEIDN